MFLAVILLSLLHYAGGRTHEEILWLASGECNNRVSHMMVSWSDEIEIRLTPPIDTSEYEKVCTIAAEFNDTTASGLHISISGRTVCTTEAVITASCRERLICYSKEIRCGATVSDEYWADAYKIHVTVKSKHTGLGDVSKPLLLAVAPVYNMNGNDTKGLGKSLIYVIIGVAVAAVLVFIGVPLFLCFCCNYSSQSADIQQPPGPHGYKNGNAEVNSSERFNLGTYKHYSNEQAV